MHNFEMWLLTAVDKYKISKTYNAESKNDSPREPYKSKYKAKEILVDLLADLDKFKRDQGNPKFAVVRGLLKFDVGVIELETEESSSGAESLSESWESIKDISLEPQCCVLALSVLNQLGILWSERGESKKALSYLTEAEKIYHNYKENSDICPYALEDVFSVDPAQKDDWKPFEKIFTLTLYYLAQVYEHLNESEKSARYCHITLKRQKESEEYDEKEWALNCATLSQYYIQEKDYLMGRHLLSCASDVLSKYEASIDNRVDDEDVWDEIRRSKAELSWCWLKYCLNLLVDFAHGDTEKKDLESPPKLSSDPEVRAFEEKAPISVLSYEEAKKAFLFGQSHVKEAKLYHTLSDHANNYVQIVQDHSKLYKNLVWYEADPGRQSKMHKRRVDMLEEVLSKLNPQFYLSVCRQLQFELGETYYEMVDLKMKMLKAVPADQAPKAVKKINFLILKAIDFFTKFVETVKDREKRLPKEFTNDLARPALVAQFYLGSLYMKIIETDTSKKLENLSNSEEYYKYILEYSERNPSHCIYIEKELPVVREMIQLMPDRVQQVTGSVLF